MGFDFRVILTGAAPANFEILKFLRIAFGINVLEGYGQTETCGAGFSTLFGDHNPPFGSNVGVPISSCGIFYSLNRIQVG